ncbi:MAG: hypothetical protein KJ906_02485 [Nanoarchaeota archaeon]|nr:hypothetical protein [Nanoarchaeota archaeon]
MQKKKLIKKMINMNDINPVTKIMYDYNLDKKLNRYKDLPRFSSEDEVEKWAKEQTPEESKRCKYAIGMIKGTDEILCNAPKTVKNISITADCSNQTGYLGRAVYNGGLGSGFSTYILDVYRCDNVNEIYYDIIERSSMAFINPLSTDDCARIAELCDAETKQDKVILQILPKEVRLEECSDEFKELAYSLAVEDKIRYFDENLERKINDILGRPNPIKIYSFHRTGLNFAKIREEINKNKS